MSRSDLQLPSSHGPTVTITEQPAQIYRFRYVSEIDKARFFGSLPGASTDNRTYPTIRVDGYRGPYAVLLSLVNSDNNYVHPHTVRGTDPRYICTNGTIYVITETPEVVFNNIGIICVKEKTVEDVREALTKRQEMSVDPFNAGYAHIENHSVIDFTAVRLCFQVFLPDFDWTPSDDVYDPKKYYRPLEPITSTVIYDAKKYGDLKIKHISSCAGPLSGGTEMNLWCENKYTGQNPDVVFYDKRGWTQKAKVTEYHKQLVMRFDAPPYPNYKDCNCADKIEVYVHLEQSSKRGVSRSLPVTVAYLSNKKKHPPADNLHNKKEKSKAWKRCSDNSKKYDFSAMPGTSSQAQQESPSSGQESVNYEDTSNSGLDPINNSNDKIISSSNENSSQSRSFHSTKLSESLSPIYDIDLPMSTLSTTNSQKSGEPDSIVWDVPNTPTYTLMSLSNDSNQIDSMSTTTSLNTSEILSEILDMESKINREAGNVDLANADNLVDQIFPIHNNQNLLRKFYGSIGDRLWF